MIPWTTVNHEDIDAQEILNFLATRDIAIPVLRALYEQPASVVETLADRIESTVSRATLDNAIEDLGQYGFVATNDSEQFETTLLGKYALDIYDTLADDLSEDGVQVLAKSEFIGPILAKLHAEPSVPISLVRSSSIDASRSTVQRGLGDLKDLGWVERDSLYQLTESDEEDTVSGVDALEAYQKFVKDLETVIDRAEFLRFYELEPMDVEALYGTTIHEFSTKNPTIPSKAFVGAIHPGIDHVRGISPVVVEDYVDAFVPLVKARASIELILDEETIETFRTNFPTGYFLASRVPGVSLLVHPEKIGFGIAILDDESVWLGTYDDHDLHRATLEGSNDKLVQWANEQVDSYREQAYVDPESHTIALWDTVGEYIPFVDNPADDAADDNSMPASSSE